MTAAFTVYYTVQVLQTECSMAVQYGSKKLLRECTLLENWGTIQDDGRISTKDENPPKRDHFVLTDALWIE